MTVASIKSEIRGLEETEILTVLVACMDELRTRKILRGNLVGDLGEVYAIRHYRETATLPKLQRVMANMRNVDAVSIKGERYSIKSITTKTTGTFWGMQPPDSAIPEAQVFEYVIIVKLGKTYELRAIYELPWLGFIKHRKWVTRMNAYNLSLTRALKTDCKIIFEA